MKQVFIEKWEHVSHFGNVMFFSVPILVEDDFPAEVDSHITAEANDKRIIGPTGAIVDEMEREAAKKWLIEYCKFDKDGNHTRRFLLTTAEVQGILSICGINAATFCVLVGIEYRGTMSKILKGTLSLSVPSVKIAIDILADELRNPGFTKKLAARPVAPSLKGLEPHFNMKSKLA